MGYEQAPSTHMLATHCVICNRALRDAVSVEIGIGPICRGKSGYDEIGATSETRSQANRIIHHISLNQHNSAIINSGCRELIELGFSTVVQAIVKRIGVHITQGDSRFFIKAPLNWDWVWASGNINGKYYNRKTKEASFPLAQKARVYETLKTHYLGYAAYGPKGFFMIGE
jgi:hypothetical protein